MLKKVLAILLISAFTIPAVVSYMSVQHRRHQIKKEIKSQIIQGIDKKDLVRLVFASNQMDDLQWKEEGREFKFEGKMYDIVEQEHTQDSTVYWTWLDEKENHLESQLHELLAKVFGSDQQTQNQKNHLLAFLKQLFFEYGEETQIALYDEIVLFEHYTNGYKSCLLSIPTPPPIAV